MQPAKTEQGRAALAARDASLTPADRRLLILADGKRTPAELATMLGADTPTALERLAGLGFLVLYEPQSEPAPPTPAEPPSPAVRSRRSAGLAKIYLLDRLQLIRHPDTNRMTAMLNAAATDHDIRRVTDVTLRFVAELSGARYARKLADSLREIVPEDWLAEFDASTREFAEMP